MIAEDTRGFQDKARSWAADRCQRCAMSSGRRCSRSPRGGLGLSVILGNQLVVALGAVTAVQLAPNENYGPTRATIRTWYGAWPPPQDADKCVSIVRAGSCSDVAACASTLLLATSDALHVKR